MMNPEDELRGFLDNDQFVTFRWLANFLNIHVEQSKSILNAFKIANHDVCATYCISGQLKNNQNSMTVVPENNLEMCKDMFSVINCIHVYSLQKRKFLESGNIPVQLNAADLLQANELIAQQPPCTSFLLNVVGGVKLEGSSIKPVGKRVAAIVRTIPATSSINSNSTEGQMMKAFAAGGTGKEKDKVGAASSSSAGKDNSKEKEKSTDKPSKSASMASAFFAKAAAATAATPIAVESAKAVKAVKIAAEKETKTVKPSIANIEKESKEVSKEIKEDNDDDDDEWNEEGAASYKPDKKKLAGRKVPKNTTVETKEPVTATVPSSMLEISTPSDAESNSDNKKVQLHVRGAMDDYMEDVAIEKFNATQESGDSSAASTVGGDGKRTKKKLVEKVRIDRFVTFSSFFLTFSLLNNFTNIFHVDVCGC